MEISFSGVDAQDFKLVSSYVDTVLLQGYSINVREIFSGVSGNTYEIAWVDSQTLTVGAV